MQCLSVHTDPVRELEKDVDDGAVASSEQELALEAALGAAVLAELQEEVLRECHTVEEAHCAAPHDLDTAAGTPDATEEEEEEDEMRMIGEFSFDSSDFIRAHPFLDVDEQRQIIATEKWRDHAKWCDRLASAQRLSFENRRVALKILINEAFARDLAFCRASSAFDLSTELRLRREWKTVAERILRDMEDHDNSSLVLRNLSCMCIFIPHDVSRQYGENHESRMRRMENMRDGLRRLQERGALFHSPHDDNGNSSSNASSSRSSDGEEGELVAVDV